MNSFLRFRASKGGEGYAATNLGLRWYKIWLINGLRGISYVFMDPLLFNRLILMHPDQEVSRRRSHLEVKLFMSCQAREALLVCDLHPNWPLG